MRLVHLETGRDWDVVGVVAAGIDFTNQTLFETSLILPFKGSPSPSKHERQPVVAFSSHKKVFSLYYCKKKKKTYRPL